MSQAAVSLPGRALQPVPIYLKLSARRFFAQIAHGGSARPSAPSGPRTRMTARLFFAAMVKPVQHRLNPSQLPASTGREVLGTAFTGSEWE